MSWENSVCRSCAALFNGRPLGSEWGPFIAAFEQGLRQQSPTQRISNLEELPSALAKRLTTLWQDETRDERLIRLLARLGFEPARNRALALAVDANDSPAARAVERVPKTGPDVMLT